MIGRSSFAHFNVKLDTFVVKRVKAFNLVSFEAVNSKERVIQQHFIKNTNSLKKYRNKLKLINFNCGVFK